MKIIKVFGILTLILTLFSGCGLGNGDSTMSIGMVISSLENPFFVEMKVGAETEAAKRSIPLEVLASDNNLDIERQSVEDLIEDGADIILLNPVDSSRSLAAIEYAVKENVPVITIDRQVDGAQVLAHISSDNVSGGELAGGYIQNLLDGQGRVLLIEGIQGTSANAERVKGFLNALEGSEINVIQGRHGDFDRLMAYDLMRGFTESGIIPDAIFAVNDEMALGAMDALIESGHSIPVVGFDGTSPAVNAVMNGFLAGTVAQQPQIMGEIGIENAQNYFEGNDVDSNVLVALEMITLSSK